jgi:hypothetical protein
MRTQGELSVERMCQLAGVGRAGFDARPYGSREELQTHLEEFIEAVYNRVRLHSALGYLSPEEFESEQARLHAAGASGGRWLPAALSFPRHEEIFPDAS